MFIMFQNLFKADPYRSLESNCQGLLDSCFLVSFFVFKDILCMQADVLLDGMNLKRNLRTCIAKI